MREFLLSVAFCPIIACSLRGNTPSILSSSLESSVFSSLRGRRVLTSSYPADYPFAYEWNTSLSSFQRKYYDLPADSPSLQRGFLTDSTMPFKWHGQAKQDRTVLEIYYDKADGYFIDLAANEWLSSSNTFVLEYYNHWKGVCIEPLLEYIIPLLAHRKCTLFVNPVSEKANEIVKFRMNTGLSGIVGTDNSTEEVKEEMDNIGAFNPKTDLELMTTTLTAILDFAKAPAIIDYLSLDIEGAEYFAMKGLDFSRYTIWLMSIERPKPKLHYLLIQNGYMFLFQNSYWGDCFYVHHTIPEFVKIMNARYSIANTNWYEEKTKREDNKEYLSYPTWNREKYIPFEEVLKSQPFPHHWFKGVVHEENGKEKGGQLHHHHLNHTHNHDVVQ
jgi:hypothetical protein